MKYMTVAMIQVPYNMYSDAEVLRLSESFTSNFQRPLGRTHHKGKKKKKGHGGGEGKKKKKGKGKHKKKGKKKADGKKGWGWGSGTKAPPMPHNWVDVGAGFALPNTLSPLLNMFQFGTLLYIPRNNHHKEHHIAHDDDSSEEDFREDLPSTTSDEVNYPSPTSTAQPPLAEQLTQHMGPITFTTTMTPLVPPLYTMRPAVPPPQQNLNMFSYPHQNQPLYPSSYPPPPPTQPPHQQQQQIQTYNQQYLQQHNQPPPAQMMVPPAPPQPLSPQQYQQQQYYHHDNNQNYQHKYQPQQQQTQQQQPQKYQQLMVMPMPEPTKMPQVFTTTQSQSMMEMTTQRATPPTTRKRLVYKYANNRYHEGNLTEWEWDGDSLWSIL